MPRTRQVPESEIEMIRSGEARSADVARKWGVSRQAVSARVYYRPRRKMQNDRTDMRRWMLLFLYRIGVSSEEISEILGYTSRSAKVLLTKDGVPIREVFYPERPKFQNSPQLRRWSAYFLMRLGFEDDEVAELTGYSHGTVRCVYRTWFRRMVRKGGEMRANNGKKEESQDYEFLPVSEVSGILRVSRAQVYNILKRSGLPAYDFGGVLRVSREDLNEFIERSKTVHDNKKARHNDGL